MNFADDVHALVEEARAGSDRARAEIFDRYHGPIYRFAWARLQSGPDAEDAVSETFLAAFAALPAFRWRGVPFEAWLFRVARSKVIDIWRRRRLEDISTDKLGQHAADMDSTDWPGERIERHERRTELAAALDRLQADHRDVLVMRFLLGRSVREVAAAMRRSDGAVRQLQARALLHLRRELER